MEFLAILKQARTPVRFAYQLVEILGGQPQQIAEPRDWKELAEWLSAAHDALSEARSRADSVHQHHADQMPRPPAVILDDIADLISFIQEQGIDSTNG